MDNQIIYPAKPAVPSVNFGDVFEDFATDLPAVEAVVSDAKELKTGYKTSEFWITLTTDIATLAGGLLPANSVPVKVASAVASGVVTVAYIAGRVHLKKHQLYANAIAKANEL